jgi:activator of aromatic catabolism
MILTTCALPRLVAVAEFNQNDYLLLQFEGGASLRADDLDPKELLELDPDGGVIRFAGQRALLLDAVAMGLLRKYLVENFGLTK